MWYLVIDTATGGLISEGSVVATELPGGLEVQTRETRPDWTVEAWDAATKTCVARPPRTTRVIGKDVFLRRLGLPTLAATLAREATDPTIAALRLWLDSVGRVDLDTPEVQAGTQHLVALGVLSAAARDALLAAEVVP